VLTKVGEVGEGRRNEREHQRDGRPDAHQRRDSLRTATSLRGQPLVLVQHGAAGYPVFGEERNREHAQPLVEQGLQWRDTPHADAADEVLSRAEELGYGRRDIAALFEVLARLKAEPPTSP